MLTLLRSAQAGADGWGGTQSYWTGPEVW